MTGACVSTTVTVRWHDEGLPSSSVAVKVTIVTPTGKKEGASLVMAGVESQTSVALTPAKNAASCGSSASTPRSPVHSAATLAGQEIVGGVVSTTVTCIVSVSVANPSSTSSVTVVVPFGKFPVGVAE